MSEIVENVVNESVAVTVTTKEKKPKPPVLQTKFLRYKVFGYWLLNQLKDKDLITTEAITEIYNTIEFYSSVETQTELYNQFDKELFNDSKKTMNKEIASHNKPAKKESVKKNNLTTDNEAKPKVQRKKKTQEVAVVLPTAEQDLYNQLIAPPAPVMVDNSEAPSKTPTDEKPNEKETKTPIDENLIQNVVCDEKNNENNLKEPKEPKEPKEKKTKEPKEHKEPKEKKTKEPNEPKEKKTKEPKEPKEKKTKKTKEPKEPKEKKTKKTKETKEPKEPKEPKEKKTNEAKPVKVNAEPATNPVETNRPSTPILEEESFEEEESFDDSVINLDTAIVNGNEIYYDEDGNVYNTENNTIIGKYNATTNEYIEFVE